MNDEVYLCFHFRLSDLTLPERLVRGDLVELHLSLSPGVHRTGLQNKWVWSYTVLTYKTETQLFAYLNYSDAQIK